MYLKIVSDIIYASFRNKNAHLKANILLYCANGWMRETSDSKF